MIYSVESGSFRGRLLPPIPFHPCSDDANHYITVSINGKDVECSRKERVEGVIKGYHCFDAPILWGIRSGHDFEIKIKELNFGCIVPGRWVGFRSEYFFTGKTDKFVFPLMGDYTIHLFVTPIHLSVGKRTIGFECDIGIDHVLAVVHGSNMQVCCKTLGTTVV
jgi:hypothetical protein